MKAGQKIEFGDFQSPPALARQVCELIRDRCGSFDTVLEPTCGVGAFLLEASDVFPAARLLGCEINPEHAAVARAALVAGGAADRSEIRVQDFFAADWPVQLSQLKGRLLLLGNPPWVTNAGVAVVGGGNLPAKTNFQGLRGLAARTGKANFDISESMLLQLIEAVRTRAAVLAMLCKTGTARKVLQHAWNRDGRVLRATLHRIDAGLHFDAAVDACLLLVELGSNGPAEADLYLGLTDVKPTRRFGMAGRRLVADLPAYRRWQHLEKPGPYKWRSGVKHDCAPVMELSALRPGLYRNSLGEEVGLEPEVLWPLLKCTQLAHGRIIPEKWMLLTQRRMGEPTATLASSAPLAWAYLQRHRGRFAARKSSIYEHTEPFALFGIGDYAFAPWKVAISGLHRPHRFLLVPGWEGRSMIFDDTCYFAPFWSEEEARITAEILNSEICAQFLDALVFPESKRSITTEVLQRLDIHGLAREAGRLDEWEAARKLGAAMEQGHGQLALMIDGHHG